MGDLVAASDRSAVGAGPVPASSRARRYAVRAAGDRVENAPAEHPLQRAIAIGRAIGAAELDPISRGRRGRAFAAAGSSPSSLSGPPRKRREARGAHVWDDYTRP